MTNCGEVTFGEIAEIPRVLHDIFSYMFTENVASELFSSRKFNSVVILARGTSDNAGHFLNYLIETKIGLPCAIAFPSAATMYQAKFHYKETLVVAISQRGQSEDLLVFARTAKEGGDYLHSFKNNRESPLAKFSNTHILILAGPELVVTAASGQIMKVG
jgi:glucosamine--fructose-6-phosphate aminotransferase (isomerizing)